ncbi:hypothetical protein BATDEDRAFT_36677 [Batrachochytrium dendrobatidis JAM81]|uniref:Uncharacterized protein n=2 Tax=Batrachochytrium dendrobatidis TaxID=109871 RepID=F4NYF5_BATDJ|nr:uncharacterized protein BATDEDRAFT_36677 [Batrachochytrium dendrobatidis JAM81]EGF82011.1 hypothetical protein BATDEDRAFT_36677 [Batrachochytrium dendrobatidis JAM81]|eukprot:XP_006677458.1 hypothetical protein BATDEDRAFT_36677 [Batrachochytrium dendrobatidis JAM81]
MNLFRKPKPKTFSIYDLPHPLTPPQALIDRTVPPVPEGVCDIQDPLSVAIFYHELNQLPVASYYFSLSAAQGNPLGLFLFAISMRHGWGMQRNEEEAVRLLQVAANQATGEVAKQAASLRRLRKRYSFAGEGSIHSSSNTENNGTDSSRASGSPHIPGRSSSICEGTTASPLATSGNHGTSGPQKLHPKRDTLSRASKQNSPSPPSLNELVLAVYELAISFKQGWGVPKSKITAVYYLNMAAELGDPDAQMELAECYLRGDGIKPNKQKAAFWLRKAEQQGARLVQMQWIWKDKYNVADEEKEEDSD